MLKAFGLGLGGPIIVLSLSFIIAHFLMHKSVSEVFQGRVWRWIFVFGIFSSLWVQFAVTFYFEEKDYFLSAKYKSGVKELNLYIPASMVGSAIVSLVGIETYSIHISFTIVYLGLLSYWDFAVWKLSDPISERRDLHQQFQKCCSQLLLHVDGVVFLILLFWAVVVMIFVRSNQGPFSPHSDVEKLLANCPNSPAILTLFSHELSEALMGGVVGFHTILSVVLLMIHLFEWGQEDSPSVSPPPGLGSLQSEKSTDAANSGNEASLA
jgi:hypothetical protein